MRSEAIKDAFILVVEGVDPWRIRSGGGPAPDFFTKAGIKFLVLLGPISAEPTRDTKSNQTSRIDNDYHGDAGVSLARQSRVPATARDDV